MKAQRFVPVLLFASASVLVFGACEGPSKKELVAVTTAQTDTLSNMRNEMLEQVMEGTRFVNEINKELSKARSLATPPRQLQSTAEIADANEERKQVVARISQLVARLDQVQSRLSNARAQLAEKDSALSGKIAEYEKTVAEISQAAEKERAEFQLVIDGQNVRIASLTNQVDTLSGKLSNLTAVHNEVYFVAGTAKELAAKGVLVPEGRKRFLLAGARPMAPARELDPSVFTKLDRLTDSTIVLPDGEYKIVTRQSTAYATPQVSKDGKIAGALKIEQPERFWSTSKFLILVRS
jgi:hypothetical protein